MLQEVKVLPLRERVAARLREAFLAGHFQPGADLVETDLASQLKVSRGHVRDALLMLAEQGLVVYTPNRGFFVATLTDDDFMKIDEIRLVLEPIALESARERVSQQDIQLLSDLKMKLLDAFDKGDFPLATQNDLKFHESIWEHCQNEWVVRALRRIMIPYYSFTMAYKAQPEGLTKSSLAEEHEKYIGYLKREIDLSAAECVKSHLHLTMPPASTGR